MTPKELMIGDWIICHHPSQKEAYVKIDGELLRAMHLQQLGFVRPNSPLRRIFKPIPLNRSILEMNGFQRKRVCSFYEEDKPLWSLEHGRFVVTYMSDKGCPMLTIEDVVDKDPQHTSVTLKDEVYNVHELQHALKMCGVNKKIVL